MVDGVNDDKKGKSRVPNTNVRIYRRPAKKKVKPENVFGIGEGFASRSSEWKSDTKIVAIVNKVAAGFDLAGSDFSSFVFMGASLSKAKMSSCKFKDADLSLVNMMNGKFSYSDFSNANLQNANLSNADLSYADFTGANLAGANLTGANLTGAKIDLVLFSEDTDFGGVVGGEKVQKYIDKIEFLQKAAECGLLDLRTLGIVDLRKLDLRNLNLKGVFLKDKELKGRLTGVNLVGAEINESDILGADVNMLHYQMKDINDYNEFVDMKAALRRERYDEEDRISLEEQNASDAAKNSMYEKEHSDKMAEEELEKSRLRAEAESAIHNKEVVVDNNLKEMFEPDIRDIETHVSITNTDDDKNISQNDEKCRIIKKAGVRIRPLKGKLID